VTRFSALPRTCERARQWASLRLDGELSELEHALLEAHVDSCRECAGFIADVDALTSRLRSAEPAHPSQAFEVPRRRRSVRARALPAAAAAAVAAVAVGLGVLFGSLGSSPQSGPAVGAASKAPMADDNALLRAPRLAQMKAQAEEGRRTPRRGLGILV
jgi:predicted anti-sigma-YlaC factor YlaD